MRILLLLVLCLLLGLYMSYRHSRRGQIEYSDMSEQVSGRITPMFSLSGTASSDSGGSAEGADNQGGQKKSLVTLLLENYEDENHAIDFSKLGINDIEELFGVARQSAAFEQSLAGKTEEILELKRVSRDLVLDLVKARGVEMPPASFSELSANEPNIKEGTAEQNVQRHTLEAEHDALQQHLEQSEPVDGNPWVQDAEQFTNLQATLEEKERRIDALNVKIQKYRVLEASRSRQDQQLSELRQKLSKALVFEQRLIAQNNEFVDLKKKAETNDKLTRIVADQEKRIQEFKLKEFEFSSVKSELNNKDKELFDLRSQQQHTEKLSATLAEREKNIDDLRVQLQQVSVLESTLINQEQKLEALQGESARAIELETSLREVQLRYDARYSEVQGLRVKLQRSAELEQTLEEKEHELTHLQQSSEEASACADAQSARMETELDQLRGDLQRLKTNLKGTTQILAEREAINNQYKKELDAARVMQLRFSKRSDRESEAADKDRQLEKMKKELSELRLTLEKNSKTRVAATDRSKKAAPAKRRKAATLYKAPATKDNLQLISGIGPAMEKLLNTQGIQTFQQLAAFKREDIDKVEAATDIFSGRIRRDKWVNQAKVLARKKSA